VDAAVAPHFHLDARRQGVGDGDADAMQAAGEGIGRLAGFLVELAAGVQARERQHHHRHLLLGMRADRNAAAVVGHGDGAVGMQHDMDVLREAGQCLVGGVVDHR
jgi:hypothetical protein